MSDQQLDGLLFGLFVGGVLGFAIGILFTKAVMHYIEKGNE